MEFNHKPIMLNELLEMLNIKEQGTYIDGTLGGAGHAAAVLARLDKGGMLIGLDRDADAIAVAKLRLDKVETKGKFIIEKANFAEIKAVCTKHNVEKVDGILLDLGVSSYQFDTPERGFSYRAEARLDMRMDQESELDAYKVVNEYTEKELKRILREYAQEPRASRIARNIVIRRQKKNIETTFELVDIIKASIPAAERQTGGHPAKRTFQAIRIEVNGELAAIEKCVDEAIDLLAPGGRACIITFHSLEDRIVKNKFKAAQSPCTCPRDFPVCICGNKSKGKMLTSKPITSAEDELEDNNRARSAKLRVFEKF